MLQHLAGGLAGYAAVQALYDALDGDDRAYSPQPNGQEYDRFARSPSPRPTPYERPPTPPRPRLRRRESLDKPISEYIRDCCVDIIGTDGRPGLNNRQAVEQIFFLQNRALQHLEEDHIDEPEYAVNDLHLKKEAAGIRDQHREALQAARRAETRHRDRD